MLQRWRSKLLFELGGRQPAAIGGQQCFLRCVFVESVETTFCWSWCLLPGPPPRFMAASLLLFCDTLLPAYWMNLATVLCTLYASEVVEHTATFIRTQEAAPQVHTCRALHLAWSSICATAPFSSANRSDSPQTTCVMHLLCLCSCHQKSDSQP
jgi:hypothetical protein